MRITPGQVMWHTSIDGGCLTVTVTGRIDTRSCADLRQVIHHAIDAGPQELLLDLRDAEVGDATGLGLLVECHRRARRHGRQLEISAMSDRTRRLLLGIRLDRHLLSA